MNTLIIYAHPNREGHCGHYLHTLCQKLEEVGRDYELLDLYEVSFEPVMRNEEHYTSNRRHMGHDVEEYQRQITEAENLIVIFPTWWQSMPAILKGFFDRVLLPGFAFTYNGSMPVGLLKGRRAVAFTSSAGPRIHAMFVGDLAIRAVRDTTLKFCGYKAKAYAVGGSTELSERNKSTIEKQVGKAVRFLT